MSDLISRSALIEKMNDYISHTDERNSEHYVCKRIKKIIEDAPTVEAKSVVYGEWIEDQVETGDPFGNGYYLIDMLRCSVCGAFFDISETRNFCPECGADMRKKVE